MSSDDATPYNGTLAAEPVANTKTPTTEFYRLPLKEKNEITVAVKASSDASILLFDGSKSSDASEIKVEIVLGSDKNSTVSVGLAKDDGSGKFNKALEPKDRVLSATHFKRFTVRWANGRVMVYNDGFPKPFISWDGPPECSFSHVGVRTLGCSGEWIVQGMPVVKTVDGKEYHEVVINSGRIDFEVCGHRDTCLVLHPEAKFDVGNIFHFGFGCAAAMNGTYFWWNYNEGGHDNDGMISGTDYRRFWVKWDNNNVWMGHGGSDKATVNYTAGVTSIPVMKYFSLQIPAPQTWAYFHILDSARPEDTAGAQGAGTGGVVAPSAAGGSEANDVGVRYVVCTYTYKD